MFMGILPFTGGKMNAVLEKYIETIPVIKDAFGMDIMMSITDGNRFLAYWP